ncbi:hypothetical protein ACFOLK_18210 [Marinococcus halophilus]|uniref:hypothetical protein n=1 Tax=Marinococcus halophilus TaxID=1371 RepID=UPI003622CC35
MKKWKCVSSILITGLVLPLMASCSTDAQGEEQQDLTFTMGHMDPPHHIQGTEVMEPFDEKVGKLTNEKVNFQIYPGVR